MAKQVSEKQANTRERNFSKRRMKAMVASLRDMEKYRTFTTPEIVSIRRAASAITSILIDWDTSTNMLSSKWKGVND